MASWKCPGCKRTVNGELKPAKSSRRCATCLLTTSGSPGPKTDPGQNTRTKPKQIAGKKTKKSAGHRKKKG